MNALIVGASGMVGSQLLPLLLESHTYDRVYSVGRTKLAVEHPKLVQLIGSMNELPVLFNAIDELADAFCTLGTTLQQAGGTHAQYELEHDRVLDVARLARMRMAQQFVLVSSVGADASSKIFYLRLKGETERDLGQLGYPGLHLLRPSLLLGQRRELRIGERIGTALDSLLRPLMVGNYAKYKGIKANVVAMAMLRAAEGRIPGTHVYEGDQIAEVAGLK